MDLRLMVSLLRVTRVCGVMAAVLTLTCATGGQGLAPATASGNVTIQLPQGWAVQVGTGRSVVAARNPRPDQDNSGQFQATLSITQDPGKAVNGAAQQAQLANAMTNYRVVEAPAPIQINGMQGVRFAGTFTSGGLQLFSRQYMFAVNNQIYVMTFTCLTSRWPAYQGTLETSAATFNVHK